MSYVHTEFKFGAKSIREINGPFSLATGVIEYADSSIVIATPGDFFRYENNKYKDRFYYKFVATSYSKNYNCLFGITENPSTIVVLSLSQIGHPIIKAHSIAQNNVKKIFFFEKSKMLLVVGDSVRCYGVYFDPFSIYLDKIFTDEILLSKSAIADYENDIVYLPTKDGYSAYDLSGICSQQSLFLDSIEYYSKDLQDGLIFDSEHMIFLINNFSVNIVNIKSKKNFKIVELSDKANRIFLADDNKIALSFDGKITFYEISLFWKTWIPSISNPRSIVRYNKSQSAARILVQGENSDVYFMSPRDGLEIAKIESQNQTVTLNSNNTKSSSSYFYDRGYCIYTQFKGSSNSHAYRMKDTTRRERFFMISKEGFLTVYNTNVWPFEEITWKDIDAKSATVCKFEDSWNYLISTTKNELLLMNPKTFEITKKFQVTGPPILSIDYYYPTNVILLIREHELTFYDLKKDFPLCRTTVNKFNALKTNGEILYLGFENGSIERVLMTNRALKSKDKVKAHDAPVTDFAFSSSFWLSSAKDGSINVWDYKLHAILSKIFLPTQINCLCVINGHKDITVGIDNAVMLLNREIFMNKNKKDEKESKIIDSYDTIKDRFVPISSQDPIRPNEYISYPLSNDIAPSKEFPISIFTFGNTSQPVGVHSPRKPHAQSARFNRSPRNIFGKSSESNFNATNTKNENEEYEYDKYDYIEYDEENNNQKIADQVADNIIMDISNSLQNETNYEVQELRFDEEENNDNDNDIDDDDFFAHNTYNANCPVSNTDISDNEEFQFDDFHKDFSQPVASTPMRRAQSRNPQCRKIITAPLLSNGPIDNIENIDNDDMLFANTQPESGMPITAPAPLTITKSMRIFADDAESDSDDDEFFKERFPLRSRNSLYIESTQRKRRVPYMSIPTDLYETTKPKLKPHAKIITPKPETPKKKSTSIRT